ncbi:MAG: hypothetical protein HFJ28_01315, partial [Clostridia bacterium]|nr:hypothetical protein [Clostridia bacterium]
MRLYTHTHTHTHTSSFYTKGKSLRKEKINKLDAKNASSSIMPYIPSVSRKTATAGITLIALVVTIVVLLILAGITIQVVLQGGIIGQANKASESYKIADLRDRIDVIRIAWI